MRVNKVTLSLLILLSFIFLGATYIFGRELAWKGVFPGIKFIGWQKSNITVSSNIENFSVPTSGQSRILISYWLKRLNLDISNKHFTYDIYDADALEYGDKASTQPFTIRLYDERDKLIYALGIPDWSGGRSKPIIPIYISSSYIDDVKKDDPVFIENTINLLVYQGLLIDGVGNYAETIFKGSQQKIVTKLGSTNLTSINIFIDGKPVKSKPFLNLLNRIKRLSLVSTAYAQACCKVGVYKAFYQCSSSGNSCTKKSDCQLFENCVYVGTECVNAYEGYASGCNVAPACCYGGCFCEEPPPPGETPGPSAPPRPGATRLTGRIIYDANNNGVMDDQNSDPYNYVQDLVSAQTPQNCGNYRSVNVAINYSGPGSGVINHHTDCNPQPMYIGDFANTGTYTITLSLPAGIVLKNIASGAVDMGQCTLSNQTVTCNLAWGDYVYDLWFLIGTQAGSPPTCESWTNFRINQCTLAGWTVSPKDPACYTTTTGVNLNISATNASTIELANVIPSQYCSDYSGGWTAPRGYNNAGEVVPWTLPAGLGDRKVCGRFTNAYGSVRCGGIITLQAPTPTPTPTPPPPPPPTNLTASCPFPGGQATLSWSPSAGATRYAIRVDDKSNGWSETCSWTYTGDKCVDNWTSTTYPFTSIPGHTYSWWIHAINNSGWSGAVYGSFDCPTCTSASITGPSQMVQGETPSTFRVYPVMSPSYYTPSAVNFTSSNTSAVIPGSASGVNNGSNWSANFGPAPGASVGSTSVVRGVVYGGGIASPTCQPSKTVTIVGSPAWWQVSDADVWTSGSLVSALPGITTKFDLAGPGGFPGIPVYGGTSKLDGTNVSDKRWIANSGSAVSGFDYDYFESLIPDEALVTEFNNASRNGSYFLTNGTQDSRGYKWFRAKNPTSLSINIDFAVTGGQKIIVFVESNELYLNANLPLIDGKSFFMVISKGNINVNKSVTGLGGVYVTDKQFLTAPTGSSNDATLNFDGTVVAWDGVKLNRNLSNNANPAEKFIYRPDMIFKIPPQFGISRFSQKEVSP